MWHVGDVSSLVPYNLGFRRCVLRVAMGLRMDFGCHTEG